MHIGQRIRQIREIKKISQKEISQKTGFSQGYISDLEKQDSCRTNTLEAICTALGVTPSFFFSDETDPEAITNKISEMETESALLSLVKEIGMDYLILSKELKESNLSPGHVRKTIEQLKSLGLLQNM